MWFQDNLDCRCSSHLIQNIYSGFRFWFYSQKYFWYNLDKFYILDTICSQVIYIFIDVQFEEQLRGQFDLIAPINRAF